MLQAQCEVAQAKMAVENSGKRQTLVNFPVFNKGIGGAVRILSDRLLGNKLLDYVDGLPLTMAVKTLVAIDQSCTVGRALDKSERLRRRVFQLGTAIFGAKRLWEPPQTDSSCTTDLGKEK